MLGAIIGDIIGSQFEVSNPVDMYGFNLFDRRLSSFTDDTVATIGVADAIINNGSNPDFQTFVRKWCIKYPEAGYGHTFLDWLASKDPKPYNSFGNGSAMRVSPCGWYSDNLQDCIDLATKSASISHDHPEGIKGATAITYVQRQNKIFDCTCQVTVPQAIFAFLNTDSFESCIRYAVSLGGDCDTIGAMAGSIAEAYYGIPIEIVETAIKDFLPKEFEEIIKKFYAVYINPKLITGLENTGKNPRNVKDKNGNPDFPHTTIQRHYPGTASMNEIYDSNQEQFHYNMGEKILEPKITVPKIEIEADKESKEDVERFLNAWTMNIPVIQIGEGKDGETSYVLNTGDLRSLEIEIKINSIPSFSMTINDGDYKIREALKKKIDKGIIAFGYKDWLVKFNIIILNTSSEAGDAMLDLSGIIYFKDLYTIEQKIYKEKTPKDILTEILKECNLGLYVVDNDWLNIPITENFINPHDMRISAIENLIYTKTRNNIWCFDLFGYMHIGNISSMQKEEISKYTLKPHTGKQIEESPMILTSIKHDPDGKEKFEDDNKIPIDYYTINNNISELLIHNVKSYSVVLENDKEELMEDDCGEDV
ncbi:MAG: putative dinitrogenase reductase, partial [Streblomastix strix]